MRRGLGDTPQVRPAGEDHAEDVREGAHLPLPGEVGEVVLPEGGVFIDEL